MAENTIVEKSVVGLVILTGGLITNTAGQSLCRMFKSQQIDITEFITNTVCFAGGMCIVCLPFIKMFKESSGSQREKITSKRDASSLTAQVCETPALATLLDRVNEWDKIFSGDADKSGVLNKKISKNIDLEADEVTSKYQDLMKRLNDLNRQNKKNVQNLSADNQMKTCYNEGLGSLKSEFREEIISLINELKGNVQGTIDPLPLAKNNQIRSTEMTKECRRQIAVIVNEYTNSMMLKLEQVIDKFVNSVCEASKVLNDKEHKVKNALETLGFPENDLSIAPLKIELNKYFETLEKTTNEKSQMPSCKNGPRSRNVSGASAKPLESARSHALQEIIWSKYSNPESSMMQKLETPAVASMPVKPQAEIKTDNHAVKKPKSPQSKSTSKSVINEEQMKFFNFLKSEM